MQRAYMPAHASPTAMGKCVSYNALQGYNDYLADGETHLDGRESLTRDDISAMFT